MLWLCLRLHLIALESLPHNRSEAAVVLESQRVCCCNDDAAELGIHTGMSAATVRSLAGTEAIQLLERCTRAEESALQTLKCWAYTITPSLHSQEDNCLLLELGNSRNLFGGLPPLLEAIDSGLARRCFSYRPGLGPSPKAALLLSYTSEAITLDPSAKLEQRLGQVPLQVLETHFPEAIRALQRAGINSLDRVLALPNAALARRCGRKFTHYLAQVLGQEPDPQQDFEPPRQFSDSYWFGYEVKSHQELLSAAEHLLKALCAFLRHTQLGTRELQWQLCGVDRSVRQLLVRSSSEQSDWRSWYSLTRLHLERLQLEVGVEELSLQCQQLREGSQPPADLFIDAGRREPLASLLDRLRNRLGLQAVQRVTCRDEHLPEYACATGNEAGDHNTDAGASIRQQRPFWLLQPPRPLARAPATAPGSGLYLLQGPERIEDNWWQQAICRDYYIARGPAGQLYWVFCDRHAENWFIHGIFS